MPLEDDATTTRGPGVFPSANAAARGIAGAMVVSVLLWAVIVVAVIAAVRAFS